MAFTRECSKIFGNSIETRVKSIDSTQYYFIFHISIRNSWRILSELFTILCILSMYPWIARLNNSIMRYEYGIGLCLQALIKYVFMQILEILMLNTCTTFFPFLYIKCTFKIQIYITITLHLVSLMLFSSRRMKVFLYVKHSKYVKKVINNSTCAADRP